MDKETELANKRIKAYKAHYDHDLELTRATAAFEHAALKPLYLLNGGALVVYLALLGTWVSSSKPEYPVNLAVAWVAVIVWGVGLVLAVIATGLAFRRSSHSR